MPHLKYAVLSAAVLMIAVRSRGCGVDANGPIENDLRRAETRALRKSWGCFPSSLASGRERGKPAFRMARSPSGACPGSVAKSSMARRSRMKCTLRNPDGRPAPGNHPSAIRRESKAWTVEFLNVSDSFLRKQVNGGSGSVESGRPASVTVLSESPGMSVRERYLVADHDTSVSPGCVHRWRTQLERRAGRDDLRRSE